MAKSKPRNGVENSQRIRLFSLALIVATAVAYLPAWNGKPIWDDNAHITQPELRSWHGLVEVWTQVGATQQYYPLVHSVFWIEQKLWGDSVLGYHLINIFLHGFAAIVLLRILLRLKVPGAWLAAGLFALHPVQVESVAWISEIKNTLSGLFFFCSILAYLNFDQNRSRVAYFGSLALFLFGLMCKTAIAPLPAIILAVLWWRRGRLRLRDDVVPSLPFFRLCIVAGLFPALGFINVYPFIYSFVADHFQYLACVGPLTLFAAGMTMALDSIAPGKVLLRPTISFLLLLTLGALSWRQCRDYRDIETLWRTTIARNPDCWMAYSNLGSFLSARGNVDEAIRDFRKALELWPNQSKDHNNLGKALVQKGRIAEAMDHFQTALRVSPEDPDTESNIGAASLQQGDADEAISHLRRAVEKWPLHAQGHINLGNALLQNREIDAAIAEYEKTLAVPFDHAESHYSIGTALRQKGDVEEAIVHYRKALELRPDYANAHNNLGNALRQQGRTEEAVHEYEAALKSEPDSILAGNNLAWILATSPNASVRDGAKAVQLAQQANRLSGGSDPIILHTLAAAYAENRQFSEAVNAAQRALELADANGVASLAESLRSKLALYQAETPYRDSK